MNYDSTALLQFLYPILNMFLHLISNSGESEKPFRRWIMVLRSCGRTTMLGWTMVLRSFGRTLGIEGHQLKNACLMAKLAGARVITENEIDSFALRSSTEEILGGNASTCCCCYTRSWRV